MARGRMITNSICRDKIVNDLSDDTCRLLFTWLITLADCEGRTYGDAAVVRSMVFPRRENITVKKVDDYLNELHSSGLIVRYEEKGDLYVWFPKFDKNQPGLRKEREPASEIPPPQTSDKLTDVCRQTAVKLPAQEKRREVKLREEKRSEETTTSSPHRHISTFIANMLHVNELTPSPASWGKAIDTLVQAGVTTEDIRNGYEEIRDKNYTIVGAQSIVNPAIAAKVRRLGSNGHQKESFISAEELNRERGIS